MGSDSRTPYPRSERGTVPLVRPVRIPGWLRVALVLSAAWVIGSLFYMWRLEANGLAEQASQMYMLCFRASYPGPNTCSMAAISAGLAPEIWADFWFGVKIITVIPLALVWVISVIAFFTFRWVSVGFRRA
jgi:hypothetical protein